MGANGSQEARELYSSLHFLLEERGFTLADLAHRIVARGETVDIRTLQRLADPDRPLRHVDTRVLDRICRTLGIEIGDLLVFAPALAPDLHRLSAERQHRLDTLMDAHTEGDLSPGELRELESLVAEANDLDFANTKRLVAHRERLRSGGRARVHSAAD